MTSLDSSTVLQLDKLARELPGPAERGEDWSAAIHSGEFSKALTMIEQRMANGDTSASVKLWWIYCQLEIGSVPLSALSSPLEEITTELKDVPGLYPLSCNTFTRIAAALVQREQLRLAVTMLERGIEFAELSNKISETQVQSLKEVFLTLIDIELVRSEDRRESKTYVESLKTRRKSVEKSKKKPEVKATQKSKAKPLSAKTILESSIQKEEPKKEEVKEAKPDWKTNRQFSIPSSARRPVAIVATLVALYVLYSLAFSSISTTELQNRLAIQMDSSTARVMATPVLEPIDAEGLQKKAIGTSIEEVHRRLKAQKNTNDSGESSTSPKVEIDQAALAWQGDQQQPEPSTPVAVETTPPPEPKLERIEQKDEERELARKIPELDDRNATPKKVTEIDSSWRKTAVEEVTVAKDGRVYGKDTFRDANVGNEDGRIGLDGKKLEPLEVTQFPSERIYITITRADVLASPSALSRVLMKLESGSKVHATATFGPWLEVISTTGRKGYIYLQNVKRYQGSNP